MTVERPHTVCARMTDDERAFVTAVARSQNRTVSSFARDAILGASRAIVEKQGAGVVSAQASAAVEKAERRLELAKAALSENNLLKMAQSIDANGSSGSN